MADRYVAVFDQRDGDRRAHSGGVSTFASPGPGRNWWVLPAGADYPDEISVINDHGDHYNWEPNVDLPLADFVALLATVESAFTRIRDRALITYRIGIDVPAEFFA